MKIYTKKAKEGEVLIYEEVLDKIADEYNPTFSTLFLPRSVNIDKENSLLALPFYEGEIFNEKWTEATGGSLLGLDLSVEIPEVLHELSQIEISTIVNNTQLQNIPKLVFDAQNYVSEFEIMASKFLVFDLLKKDEIDQARNIIKKEFTSPLVLNNGDFYPRNFIRTPDKRLVLIDWETWNSNSPAFMIDHPENVAALCFIHMWNNPVWQKNYVKELQKRFSITKADFQKSVLIKALQQANFWFKEDGKNILCQNQFSIFRNALSEEYMNGLWN